MLVRDGGGGGCVLVREVENDAIYLSNITSTTIITKTHQLHHHHHYITPENDGYTRESYYLPINLQVMVKWKTDIELQTKWRGNGGSGGMNE